MGGSAAAHPQTSLLLSRYESISAVAPDHENDGGCCDGEEGDAANYRDRDDQVGAQGGTGRGGF